MKICIECGINKDLTEYRDDRKKCKSCYNKKRYSEKKSRMITDEVYREKVKEWDREKMKLKRSETDTLFYYKEICRNVCRNSFKRKDFIKTSKTGELLGCDWLTFKTHIESKWQDGMTWDNHSFRGWHIDHIIPIDFGKTPEDVAKLCHYTNLQPLWAEDNWEKSDKIL
jgi:hypothetical protein